MKYEPINYLMQGDALLLCFQFFAHCRAHGPNNMEITMTETAFPRPSLESLFEKRLETVSDQDSYKFDDGQTLPW